MFLARAGEERLLWYESSVKRLKEARQRPAIYLEEELADNKKGTLYLRGWAADTELLKIGLFDQKMKKLPCKLRRNARLDIQAVYFETEIEKKLWLYDRSGRDFRESRLSGGSRRTREKVCIP